MNDKLIEVTVGRVRLKVPVMHDKNTTLRMARAVNARLEEIEKRSPSIDSHAFALEAAMSFAAELEQASHEFDAEKAGLIEQQNQDTRDILIALNKISEGLENLLETIQDMEGGASNPT